MSSKIEALTGVDLSRRKLVDFMFTHAGAYLIAILFGIVGGIIFPNFLTLGTLSDVVTSIAILGIVASGHLFVTYTGQMADLSIPAIIGLSGSVAITALSFGLIPALVLGVLSGLAVGLINGFVVGTFKANAILWTLALNYALEGFMRFVWSNNQIYPNLEPGSAGATFVKIDQASLGGLPLAVIVMLVLFGLSYILMNKTEFGLKARLVGTRQRMAKFTGVDDQKIVGIAFLVTAFTASIAGIFLASMNEFAVYYLGEGYTFSSVTAIVIGGMALAGGRGNPFGVFGGVLLIGVMRSFLTFLGMERSSQDVVVGAIFILTVMVHSLYRRKYGRSYE